MFYNFSKMTTSKLIHLHFISRNAPVSVHKRYIYKYPRLITNRVVQHKHWKLTAQEELFNLLKGKVKYNCVVTDHNDAARWANRKQRLNKLMNVNTQRALPISLKYIFGDKMYKYEDYANEFLLNTEEANTVTCVNEPKYEVKMPYTTVKQVDIQDNSLVESINKKDELRLKMEKEDFYIEKIDSRWKSDYIVLEREPETLEIENYQSIYGTADSNVTPSNIPCHGCGAIMHCQDSSIPGYLPKELFVYFTDDELREVVCQRCSFLKHYNVALSISVEPNDYPKLLSHIKNKVALVILMVDMTDFPCSIWPDIVNIIGKDTHIALVGNKIDLIQGDHTHWLKHAEDVLRSSFPRRCNIISVNLISAKTGFGVESLITNIHSKWQNNGDIYLVGCTNVGKSSLFNALIRSDLCQVEAVDLVKRATVSQWPGTTLNLLKFPIMKMHNWRAFLRQRRLKEKSYAERCNKILEKLQAKQELTKLSSLPDIIDDIGMTFYNNKSTQTIKEAENEDAFAMPAVTKHFLKNKKITFLDPKNPKYRRSKWCYDTPGVVHNEQLLDLMTTRELKSFTPRRLLYPRFFTFRPKTTLFIAGLARIDLLECEDSFIRICIYSNNYFPITICDTENADEVYDTLLGSKFFCIPVGPIERLKKWPPLKSNEEFEIKGEGHALNTSEIVLSSAGWISFTSSYDKTFKVKPWTPDGRGIHFRKIPLLKYTARQRKRKISFTPKHVTRSP